MANAALVAISATLILVAGPLLLGTAGILRSGRRSADADRDYASPWDWKLTIISALTYTLAFNLTFFVQELFLVVPKALTPGLRPILFHNNQSWHGANPLASLFQGTGVLATTLASAVFALLLERFRGRSATVRLFFFWMICSGIFMALPQVVIGAVSFGSDVGMTMTFLGLGKSSRTAAALGVLFAIPPIAVLLGRVVLDLAADTRDLNGAGTRSRFVFRIATLPSLIAIPLIVLFRVPREWTEVILVPAVVSLIGTAWIQAGARWYRGRQPGNGMDVGSVAWPLGAVLLLLLIFQLLLRPGLRFY